MTMPVKKLRFGVMCAGEQLESAFAASIDELLKIDGVELALLIVDVNPPARSPLRDRLRKMLSLKGNLWAIFQWLFPLRRLSCYRPRDMSAIFAGVSRIHCRVTRKGKFSQYFDPDDVERIRAYELDFILRFAFGIIRGDILNTARYGVWSFHHDDESKFRGGPPAFWEIYHGEPTTGAMLQRLVDRLDAGIVLQKCHIRTRRWSYAANLNAIMGAAVHMPARVCQDILAGCAQYLEAAPSPTRAPVFRAPNDFQMAGFLLKTWTAWVKEQIAGVLFAEDWNVGIVNEPAPAFLRPNFRPRIRWLANGKKNTFLADPFVQSIGGGRTLLVEGFDYGSNRGSIVEMDLDENGAMKSPPRPAIDVGVHMSYPSLIEHEGRVYCVPESAQTRSVSLYAFDDREGQWRVVAPIIKDFPAVDPTIFQHAGLWWLWCTNVEDEPDSKLFLWYAFDLWGPWRPHPGNPVKVDVRSSRPAGRPFLSEGNLYRPAQDCSRTYGGGITINRVTRLSLTEFCEEPVSHITPWDSRYRAGIHTLVGDGSLSVLDGKRMVITPLVVRRRLAHKLGRLVQACRIRVFGGGSPENPREVVPSRRGQVFARDQSRSPHGDRTGRERHPAVFVLGDSLIFGGTEGQFVETVRRLNRSQWELHVGCVRAEGPYRSRLEAVGLHALACGPRSLRSPSFVLAVVALARTLRRSRVRVVHSFGFYSNILGVLAARLARVPAVIASQRELGDLRSPIERWVHGVVLRLAGHVVVNSEAVAERLKASRTVPAPRIVVIPNGVDLARFAPATSARAFRSNRITVGTLSVLRPEKAVGDLLRAAPAVRDRCPAARFVIWGDGPCRPELERLVRDQELEGLVEFRGITTQPEVALRDLDIFVLASLSEACSNALVEAMATGLPVVATRVGGIPALVEDGKTGLLVPPGEPASLARAIVRLIEDPGLAAALATRARERVQDEFGLDRMLARLEALYNRALTYAAT